MSCVIASPTPPPLPNGRNVQVMVGLGSPVTSQSRRTVSPSSTVVFGEMRRKTGLAPTSTLKIFSSRPCGPSATILYWPRISFETYSMPPLPPPPDRVSTGIDWNVSPGPERLDQLILGAYSPDQGQSRVSCTWMPVVILPEESLFSDTGVPRSSSRVTARQAYTPAWCSDTDWKLFAAVGMPIADEATTAESAPESGAELELATSTGRLEPFSNNSNSGARRFGLSRHSSATGSGPGDAGHGNPLLAATLVSVGQVDPLNKYGVDWHQQRPKSCGVGAPAVLRNSRPDVEIDRSLTEGFAESLQREPELVIGLVKVKCGQPNFLVVTNVVDRIAELTADACRWGVGNQRTLVGGSDACSWHSSTTRSFDFSCRFVGGSIRATVTLGFSPEMLLASLASDSRFASHRIVAREPSRMSVRAGGHTCQVIGSAFAPRSTARAKGEG
uniref:Uncharacterized protein n=1 Tax=Macrostomum lignano TaxID=282301 RepID=A0A1I8JND2_9PLAT